MQRQIHIRGRSYTLRSDPGDDVEYAAQDIDRRMRDLSSRSPMMDEYTVALLTALNLAAELRVLKARFRGELTEIDRQIGAIETMVEAMLGDGQSASTEEP